MKKAVYFLLGIVTVCTLSCALVWAAGPDFNNFSADVITTTHGETHTSKIYSKDGKKRMEMAEQRGGMIMITRPDKMVVWMITPATSSYREMPMNKRHNDISSQLSDPKIKSEKEFIANETVDGHPAKKYHLTVIVNGKKEASGFLWEATDMNNFPIKHQSEDKQVTTVWKNMKTGGVSDSLFEVPAGYKKMSMPAMNDLGMPRKGR
jgi:hypothetical protein